MVKFITTKRASKDVSVDQFWQMKAKMKPRESEQRRKVIKQDVSDRYKFKSFKKEIKKLDISLAHYIDDIKMKPYTTTDDNFGSFFLDELQIQQAKCTVPHYKRFYEKLVGVSQTLPLVIHNLDFIIDTIMDNINVVEEENVEEEIEHEENLELDENLGDEVEEKDDEKQNGEGEDKKLDGEGTAVDKEVDEEIEDADEGEEEDNEEEEDEEEAKPTKIIKEEDPKIAVIRRRIMTPYMMQLLPEIIRDCQHLAYRAFVEKIFLKITPLLDTKNLPLLQAIYKVLAYALKYFFPEILSNFKEFLGLYTSKLFLHINRHVRKFSSESFSYIIKKMKVSERESKVEELLAEMSNRCLYLTNLQDKYSTIQASYLKESVSQMLFSCLVGMQRFLSYRGMDQFKEILQIIFKAGKANRDMMDVLSIYLSNIFKYFTVESQTDKLCFNLTDLLQAMSLLLKRQVNVEESGLAEILKVISAAVIEFLDFKDAEQLNVENAPFIAGIIDVCIEYQKQHPDLILKQKISGAIGRLFKRGFEMYSTQILTESINKFLLQQLTVQDTLEFFKLLVLPYENNKEQVDEAYTFSEEIYNYCLVLSFNHIKILFETSSVVGNTSETAQTFQESDIDSLHCMFYMMTMIHKQSFPDKQLSLRDSKTLLTQALTRLPELLDTVLKIDSMKQQTFSLEFRQILLFTKISQFSHFNSTALIEMYEKLVQRINTFLKQTLQEHLDTKAFSENEFIPGNQLYSFDERIVKKHELKSATVNSKQRISLLKSEMLVLISSFRGSSTSQELIDYEIDSINTHLDNPNYLKNFARFLKNAQKTLNAQGKHQQFFYALCRNLSNKYTETRLASLQVLATFEQLDYIPSMITSINNETSPSILKGQVNLVQILLEIQSKVPSIDNEREIKLELSRIKTNSHAYPQEYHFLLFNFALGYLFVRFSLLWNITQELLTHLINLKKHPALESLLLNSIAYYSYRLSPQFEEKYNQKEISDISTGMEIENEQNNEESASPLQFFSKLFNDDYLFEGDSIEEKLVFEHIFKAFNQSQREILSAEAKAQFVIILQEFFKNEHCELKFEIADSQNLTELQIVQQQLTNRIIPNKHLYTKYTLFLSGFLSFISVKNIDKLFFYGVFLELLRKQRDNIQGLALDCILRFEKPQLHKYQASLKQMTKKDNIRREMLQLNVDGAEGFIEEPHRAEVIPVLINILYPHMFSRKGTHNKSKKHSEVQRSVIFEFFQSLRQNEIFYLIELVFKNYHIPQFNSEKISLELQKELLQIHMSSLLAFNTTLKNMMQKLGLLLKPFFAMIFNYLLCLFSSCQILKAQIKESKVSAQESNNTELFSTLQRIDTGVKRLQKQGIERYTEICRRYSTELPSSEEYARNFLQIMNAKMVSLRQDTVTSVPGVLKIIAVWASDSNFFYYFKIFEQILPILVSLYSRDKINTQIISVVHKIFASLFEINTENNKTNGKDGQNQDMIEEEKIMSDNISSEEEDEDNEDDDNNNNQGKNNIVKKKVIRTVAKSSELQKKEKQEFFEYLSKFYQPLLQSMYSYLEFNLSPSALIKRSKQKRLDSLSLQLIAFVSSKVQFLDEKLSLLYINYFTQFLDASNIKKLKDVAITQTTSEQLFSTSARKQAMLNDKYDIFYQVLQICSNFLKHNPDNTAFYKQFVNILPFTQNEAFKKQAVNCIVALNLPYLSKNLLETLQNMSKFQRVIKQTLDYDSFLNATNQVDKEYMKEWLVQRDGRCVETYLLMLMSSCGEEELSVRMAIDNSFQTFFNIIAENQDKLTKDNLSLVQNFLFFKLLPFIAKELRKVREEHVFKTLIQLFRSYLEFVPRIKNPDFFSSSESSNYFKLRALCHTDENQDFFKSIVHIQMSRRIKGMSLLNKLIPTVEDPSGIWSIVLPIVEYTILYKCQDIYKQSNKMKLTDTTLSHYKMLLQQSINSVGIVAKTISIAKNKKILKKYVQFLTTKKFDQKISIKVIGSVLETLSLPFDVVAEVNNEMESRQDKKVEGTLLFDMIQKNKEYDNPNQDLLEDQMDQIDQDQKNLANNEVQAYDLILDDKFDVAEDINKAKWVENIEREKYFLKTEEQSLANIPGVDQETAMYYKFLRVQVFLPMKQLLFDQYSRAYNKNAKISTQEKQRDKQNEKIRTFMTVGLIRLLVKFPKEIFRIEFPKIVNKVVKNLRTKDNDERQFARKVLIEIVRITGPYFFHYILKELKYFLKEGWEMHILNFTVFTLIQELDSKTIPIGSLDYCHSEIFPLLIDETFGKLQEEKELGFTKIPEQKKNKANSTFMLLAKNLEFRNVINFLSFIRQELIQNLDGSKNLGKFDELFNFVLDGFSKNLSVKHAELVTVSYSLIKDALELIEASKVKERMHDTTIADTPDKSKLKVHNLAKTYEISEVTAQNKSIFQSIQDSKKQNKFKIGCSLSNFGLKLCLMGIKKSIFTPEEPQEEKKQQVNNINNKQETTQNDQAIVIEEQDENQETVNDKNNEENNIPEDKPAAKKNRRHKPQTASELHFDQLIKVVVECLKSTDNSMVVSSLRILKSVIDKREAQSIRKATVKAVLGIMEKLTNTDLDMIAETFKLIKTIIECSPHDLSSSQKQALLQFVKQFMDLSDSCIEPLAVLRALIEKKIVIAEIYDLVSGRVSEMMLQSYASHVNAMCKNILLSFLVKYPMTPAITQKSVNFLIKNMEYTYEEGRATVYEVVKIITRSFPDTVLAFFGEILFVSLLVNLINEQNTDIKALIMQTQGILMERLTKEQKTKLIQNNLNWITQHSSPKIQQSGFIGLRLFLEDNQDLSKQEAQIKQSVSEIFDSREERMNVFWELIRQKREMKDAIRQHGEWKEIVEENETEEKINEEELKNDELLNSVLKFCIVHNAQMKDQSKDNNLLFGKKQEEKRLICSILQYVNFPNQITSNLAIKAIMEVTSSNLTLAQAAFTESIHTVAGLIPKLLKHLYFSKLKNNSVIEQTENTHNFFIFSVKFFIQTEHANIGLSLFENILKIFLKSYVKAYYNKSQIENIVGLVFTFAKTAAAEKDSELVSELTEYMLKNPRTLEILLEIIIKVKSTEQNNKLSNEETIQKAELALDELKKSVETSLFLQQYSKVKASIEAARLERKQQQKQDFILNPEAAFERKKDQNLKKKKAHNNKQKKGKFSSNVGKKILKTSE